MRDLNKKVLLGGLSLTCLVLGGFSVGLIARDDGASALPPVPQKIAVPGVATQLQEAYRAAAAKSEDPQSVGTYCLTLHVYGQAPAAVTCYLRLQNLKGAEPKWLYYQALAQANARQVDASMATLTRFVTQQPAYLPARIRLGAAQLVAKQPKQALATFQEAVKKGPRSASAQFGVGRAYEATGDAKAAIAAYRQALVLAPGYGAPMGRLAKLLEASGKKDEARQFAANYRRYRQVGAPEPDPLLAALHNLDRSPTAYARRAGRAAAKGDLAGATKNLQAALVSDPNDLRAHVALIDLYRRQKIYDKAEFHYRKAMALRPAAYLAEINYGRLQQDRGQADQAAAAYRRAIKADEKRAVGYLRLGALLEQQGKTTDALQQYRAAAAKQPALSVAHFHNGRLSLKVRETTAAAAAFDKAVANSSNPALTLLQVANAYGEAKLMTQALSRLDQAKQRATVGSQKRLLVAIEAARNKWQAGGANPAGPAKKK